MAEHRERRTRPPRNVQPAMGQPRGGRVTESPLIAEAHEALLHAMRDGSAGRPRELLASRSAAWADDLAAWPLVTGLLHFTERQVNASSSAARNGTYDDREWLREQRVLAVVIDVYDDIRRAVLARRNPNSGVRSPHGAER